MENTQKCRVSVYGYTVVFQTSVARLNTGTLLQKVKIFLLSSCLKSARLKVRETYHTTGLLVERCLTGPDYVGSTPTY
jgi:hypothetical protein